MQFEGVLMYFEEDTLVIFITPLYYLPPRHVVVPWGHASEGCYNLLAPTMFYLMFIGHFYVVRPLIRQF